MKNIFENSENFTKYAEIGACYYELGLLYKSIDNQRRTPIEVMVDKATGFNFEEFKHKENIKYSIQLIEQIIECKKFLKDSTKPEKKMLVELKKALKNASK